MRDADSLPNGGRDSSLPSSPAAGANDSVLNSLRDSDAFVREVVANSPDCIKVLSLEGTLLSLSENGRRLLEIDDVTPFLNSCWTDWWNGPEKEKALKAVDEARGGRSSRFEAFAPTVKGTEKWWDVLVTPMIGKTGKPEQILSVSRDVTVAKRLENERLETARAVESERANLALLFDQAPAFICTLRGPQHVFELANARYFEIVGKRDLLGKSVRDALPELDGQGFFELLDRVYQTGEPYTANEMPVVLRNPGKDAAEHRYLNFVYQPLRDANKTVSGIFVHGIDVTDGVRGREELDSGRRKILASEAYLRLVIDSSAGGFYGVDGEGTTTICNTAFLKMLGFDRSEDAVGKKLHNVIHHSRSDGSHYPKEECHIYLAARTGVAAHIDDEVFFRLDGSSFPVEYWSYPILRDGRVDGAVTTFVDITERKRAQEELKKSESRLADIMRTSLDCVIGMNHLGRVTAWNPAAEATFGYTKEEAVGQEMAELIIPAAFRGAHRAGLAKYVASGEGPILNKRLELTALVKGGKEIPVELTVTAATFSDPPVFTAFIRDITFRKNAEAEREALLESERIARSDAERTSKIKDEFLATLSHEIRTPLNAILGWTQIMRGSSDPADIPQGLEVIERNARAQSQIIEDLLDMSRIISGKVRLDVQRIDLSSIVQNAAETSRPTAEAKGIRLQSIIDPLQGVVVSGDINRLQQVLWNLLSNAIKFTPKGGRVQVLLERVNSHLEISVIDTGEGIKQEFLPFVFDRFRQADASTTRRHGGLGLGLSIVKQLVELHGGSIRVKSAGIGTGTTFIVSLPLTVFHPAAERETERRHPTATSSVSLPSGSYDRIKGLRVLAVDDEPDARALIKRLLEDCDAVVTTVSSGGEVIAMLEREEFDILISDIGMPDEDGYALIKRVRQLGKERGGIPAIAMTAYARAEDRIKAMTAGFQMHLAKPVEAAELIATVASASGRFGL